MSFIGKGYIATALSLTSIAIAAPALAHHPFESNTPTNFIQGFLSGLGHPIIGLDHFAFVVAVGLLAALFKKRSIVIPLAFALATALGAVIHLQSIDLPIAEVIIALSVTAIGAALALPTRFNLGLLTAFGSIAGIFHGWAYGEAIFGAEMTPLGAYLLGFVGIQLVVSAIAFYLGRLTVTNFEQNTSLALRFAGCVILGMGITFLSGALFS